MLARWGFFDFDAPAVLCESWVDMWRFVAVAVRAGPLERRELRRRLECSCDVVVPEKDAGLGSRSSSAGVAGLR